MGRKRQDPTKRKNEFIKTATQLFLTKGYDNTSLNEILSAMGKTSPLSPSVFYYYFKSKDELLDACLNAYVECYAEDVIALIDDTSLDFSAKIQGITTRVQNAMQDFHQMFMESENYYAASFHKLILDRFFIKIKPHAAAIISDGLKDGQIPLTNLAKQAGPQLLTELVCGGIIELFRGKSTLEENPKLIPVFITQILGLPPLEIQNSEKT